MLATMVLLAMIIGAVGLYLCVISVIRSHESPLFRILTGLAWLSAGLLVCLALNRLCQFACNDWTGVKLAPVIGMIKGYRLYQDPGTGVMTGWIYGPIGAIVLLPSALGKTPTACGLIGSFIAVVCCFGPALWLLIVAARCRFSPVVAVAMLVLGWAPMVSFDLQSAVFIAAPDAPAIGLAACACAVLQLRRDLIAMIISALLATLAIWTKQNFGLLIPALIIWIWIQDGGKAAMKFTLISAGVVLMVSIPLLACFGASNMLFHMARLPGSQPFKYHESGLWMMWLYNIEEFVAPLAPAAGLLTLAVLLERLARSSEPEWRHGFAARPWSVLLIVAILLVPGEFLGMAKVGGGFNSTAGVNYFLLLAALTALIGICETASQHQLLWQQSLRSGLIILSIVLSVHGLFDPPGNESDMWYWIGHRTDNPTEQVYHYMLAHPHQVLCPTNPLITLLAEGELYHTDMGVFDRISAGQAPPVRQLIDHFPSQLHELVYAFEPPSRVIETVVVKFHTRVERPELPNAIVITR